VEAIVTRLRSKKLPTEEKTLLTGADRGGSMLIYRDKKSIVRVAVTVGLSNRSVRTDFFYDKANLIATESYNKFSRSDAGQQSAPAAAPKETAPELRETMLFHGQKLLRWTLHSTLPREGLPDRIGDWANALVEGKYFLTAADRPGKEIEIEKFLKTGKPD
jgi:hypothetical protein